MIVTCPNCSKRYMLDDALLPKEGRQVRCITCQHIWKQACEITTNDSNLSLSGLTRESPITSDIAKSYNTRKLWLISFFLLIFSITFLIIGRNLITSVVPSLERYYDLMGLPVSVAGSGITISNATNHIRKEDDHEVVIVSGDLINTSDRVRYIPTLKVRVVGEPDHPNCINKMTEKGCILESWDHTLSEKSLLPGEQIHFETSPRQKIEGASHITLEF